MATPGTAVAGNAGTLVAVDTIVAGEARGAGGVASPILARTQADRMKLAANRSRRDIGSEKVVIFTTCLFYYSWSLTISGGKGGLGTQRVPGRRPPRTTRPVTLVEAVYHRVG